MQDSAKTIPTYTIVHQTKYSSGKERKEVKEKIIKTP
jgi:hypothetical protein